MSISTVEAYVENGQIRLPQDLHLPERTKVYVIVPDTIAPSAKASIASPRLAHPEQAVDFRKTVVQESW
jgi:hypothetical protein